MQKEGTSSFCYEQALLKSTDFEKKLLQYNAIYLEKMETGKHVYEAIVKGTVVEEALPKKYRNALKIFRKSSKTIETNLMTKKRKSGSE
jgi:hypothetical protein